MYLIVVLIFLVFDIRLVLPYFLLFSLYSVIPVLDIGIKYFKSQCSVEGCIFGYIDIGVSLVHADCRITFSAIRCSIKLKLFS